VVLYWGDIDTHGFAILNRARRAVPHLRSVFMDEETLLSHRSLWVEEAAQCPNVSLDALTAEEQSVYENLRASAWGPRIRMEQERLGWADAMTVLMRALYGDVSSQWAREHIESQSNIVKSAGCPT
jgi:hypothetical protein